MCTAGTVRLLVTCPDRPGLIAAVTGFVARQGGNIVWLDQHSEAAEQAFFMRLEIERATLAAPRDDFEAALGEIAAALDMRWRLEWGDRKKRVAILVSRQDHCLTDLLWRWRTGELPIELAFVASNHPDARAQVETLGVRFHHLPVDPARREAQEAALVDLLAEAAVDVVVLARYMQVLSDAVVDRYPERIINIHHSFLPAFPGAQPYHRAHARGVKLIGATSHYVTSDLDEGPIIAQATAPVDHRDGVADMVRAGRDLERVTLARALRLHVEDKVLVCGQRTIAF